MFFGWEEKAKTGTLIASAFLPASAYLSVCPPVRSRPSRPSIHLFVCLYLPVCLSVRVPSFRPSFCLSCQSGLALSGLLWPGLAGWLPACRCVCLSVCLPACLPVCMPSTKLPTPTCLSLLSAHSKIRLWESAHLSQRWDS